MDELRIVRRAYTVGPQGPRGPQGPVGPKGEQGPIGLKGDKGDMGPMGPRGFQGPQGEKGDKGDVGTIGPQGLKGDKGDPFKYEDFTSEQLEQLRGPQGIQGSAGPKGDPFTYEDFTAAQLEVLRGPLGIQGPQGIQGEQGPAGQDGADGADGQDGAPGLDGHSPVVTASKSGSTTTIYVDGTSIATIEDGQDGSNGTNGTNGTDGVTPHIDSTTGNWFIGTTNTGVHAQGPAGLNGSNGTNGSNGQDGDNGADGITPTITVTSISNGHNVAFSYGTGDSRNIDFNVMDGNVANQLQADWNQSDNTQADYIKNKPTIPAAPDLTNYVLKNSTSGLLKNDGTIDTSTYLTFHQDISGKANSADLATVATSGSYTDLSNKPTIPTKTSDLTNDSKYLKLNIVKNGHIAVDLNLSDGTLFASYITSTRYKYGRGHTTYTQCLYDYYIYKGVENPLNKDVDAAFETWGGDWHMPTKTQFEQLISGTNYTWETIDNQAGGKFTSKTDSNKYIFLPAYGVSYRTTTDHIPANDTYNTDDNGTVGYYLSSTPYDVDSIYILTFNSSGASISTISRDYGCNICPAITTYTTTSSVASSGSYLDLSNTPTVPIISSNHEYVDLGMPSGTLWLKYQLSDSGESEFGYQSSWVIHTAKRYNKDVGNYILGESWHLPTKELIEELIKYTTPSVIEYDDNVGRITVRLTSNIDNTKYLDFKYWYSSSFYSDATHTFMSSTKYEYDSSHYYCLKFTFSNENTSVSTSLSHINPQMDNGGGYEDKSCLKCVLDGTPTIIPTIWRGTQAQYDAITTPDDNTIYIITSAS